MSITLRRYTELPFAIDYLRTKTLKLLKPSSWDDRNDSYFIKQYAVSRSLCATYVLCLANTTETYHHWRAFSHGTGGVCIQFDRDTFLSCVREVPNIRAEPVQYKTIAQLRDNPPAPHDLPFLKRFAFSHEGEFRLFVGTEADGTDVFPVEVPLSAIERIILSPWLPLQVADSAIAMLKSIDGCSEIKMHRSTLVENEEWKRLANGV